MCEYVYVGISYVGGCACRYKGMWACVGMWVSACAGLWVCGLWVSVRVWRYVEMWGAHADMWVWVCGCMDI